TPSVGTTFASSRRAMISLRPYPCALQLVRKPPAPAATATSVKDVWCRHASCVSPIGGGSHEPLVQSPRQFGDPGGSQCSPGWTTPLPQIGRSHVAVQPGTPGGSHASPKSTVPSPQRGKRHVALHEGKSGGSQSSPGSTTPLPHTAFWHVAVQPALPGG